MNRRSSLLTWFVMVFVLGATACTSGAVAAGLPKPVSLDIDPERWAPVPAGDFLQGQFDQRASIDYDYEVMVTLVTYAQYVRFLNQAAQSGKVEISGEAVRGDYHGDPFQGYKHEVQIPAGSYPYTFLNVPGVRISYDGQEFTIPLAHEQHPMTMVTWFGARAYCAEYGWRLPTELEWEKAARGTDGRPFPWGEEIQEGNANFYASRDPYELAAGKSGDTTPAGFYNGKTYAGYSTIDSPSPYGLYDMAGNVWQWTRDDYPDQHYRYLRGGSKAEYGFNLRVWTRNSASPEYASPNSGFRCAREAGD